MLSEEPLSPTTEFSDTGSAVQRRIGQRFALRYYRRFALPVAMLLSLAVYSQPGLMRRTALNCLATAYIVYDPAVVPQIKFGPGDVAGTRAQTTAETAADLKDWLQAQRPKQSFKVE